MQEKKHVKEKIELGAWVSLSACVAVICVCSTRETRAAAFDVATGTIVTSGSLFSVGFEAGELSGVAALIGRDGSRLPEQELVARLVPGGIEGGRAVAVGADVVGLFIDVGAPPLLRSLGGRRVEIRYWQQDHGQELVGHVLWAADQRVFGELPFQLTGRGTDDGWKEWTSGPFDFALAGTNRPFGIYLYPNQMSHRASDGSPLPTAWIDAVTFDDLGPAVIPDRICDLTNEAAACGPEGACMLGRCVDAAVALSPPVSNRTHRADYLRRRVFEISRLEGGRAGQANAADFEARMMALAAEPSVIRYHAGYARALELLEDGHTSSPMGSFRGSTSSRWTSGICAHLGVADMLPTSMRPPNGRLPLVFSIAQGSPFGGRIRPGDALAAIDGLAPESFALAAGHHLAYYGDQAARSVALAPSLLDAAVALGSEVTFLRTTCEVTSTGSTCPPDRVETIRIDFGREVADLWEGQPPAWMSAAIPCDFRFHRAFEAPAGTAYAFAGSEDRDGIRTLQINGVPAPSDRDGEAWFRVVGAALADGPEKLILDQRTGNGGTMEAVMHLVRPLVGANDFDRIIALPQTFQAVDASLVDRLTWCSQHTDLGWMPNACGDFIDWPFDGIVSPRAYSTRLAVLTARDVSGNDFVTKILTYRPRGTTRIFGPAPTAGAFGVIWALPAVGHEISGGSVQVHDSVFRATSVDTNLAFQTSFGVEPDEVVLQLQSDALRNEDTVLKAARAWLAR